MTTGSAAASKGDHTNLDIRAFYESVLKEATGIRDRIKNGLDLKEPTVLEDLHRAIDEDLIDQLYTHAMSAQGNRVEVPVHAVKVASVSLKIAKGMGYDAKKLVELGLTAFMENVGMYQVPDNILNKKEALDQAEMSIIRQHPEKSYHILSQMGIEYRWLAELSLQTHERTNGSGYPKGLKGEQISELASIVGLADNYVALASDRPYRKRFLQSDAVKWIVTEGKALFPTSILKALLNEISFFPVGTHVRLNNMCIGQVLSTEKNQPLRPNIKILYDGHGKKVEKGLAIRLVEDPLLYIKEALLIREENQLRV